MHGRLTEWTRDVADVLTQPPGQPQLLALTSWLQRLGFVDHFVLFIYVGSCLPFSLFDTFPANLWHTFLGEHETGPYLLDPFYLACQFGQPDGLYRLRRLAPDRFCTSEDFHHLGLCEEFGFFTSLGSQGKGVLLLMRRRGSVPYNDDEMRLLHSAAPAVDRVVHSAWEAHQQRRPGASYDLNHRVREAFEDFGRGVLTERECEVVRLLLKGHSNVSVSRQLRISPGTVKVHRRNLYEKLEIGSQSELLALFVRELKGA